MSDLEHRPVCHCCKQHIPDVVFYDLAFSPPLVSCRRCKASFYGHEHEDGSPTVADMELGALNRSERVGR